MHRDKQDLSAARVAQRCLFLGAHLWWLRAAERRRRIQPRDPSGRSHARRHQLEGIGYQRRAEGLGGGCGSTKRRSCRHGYSGRGRADGGSAEESACRGGLGRRKGGGVGSHYAACRRSVKAPRGTYEFEAVV